MSLHASGIQHSNCIGQFPVVYSHIILRGVSIDDLVKRTRTTYTGLLVVGEVLMRFVVGEDVAIYRR